MGQWWCVWLKLSPSRIGFYQQADQLEYFHLHSPQHCPAARLLFASEFLARNSLIILNSSCSACLKANTISCGSDSWEAERPWRKSIYDCFFIKKNFSVGANELRSPNLFCVLSLCCVICQEYRMAFPNPVHHIHIISISISIISIS